MLELNRGGCIFFLCFAVNNKFSWQNVNLYRERILRSKDARDGDGAHDRNDFAIILIGTKCDLRTQQYQEPEGVVSDPRHEFVDVQTVLDQAREWNVPYIETSAKHGRNKHFAYRQSVYEYWIQSQTQSYFVNAFRSFYH